MPAESLKRPRAVIMMVQADAVIDELVPLLDAGDNRSLRGAFGWNVDRGAMASIWRGGCIIRARFLDRVRQPYDAGPELPSLLVAPYFAGAIKGGVTAWRRVVSAAVQAGVPSLAFSSSLAYYDALRAERLPAALIQGLRDNFGAHTYQRTHRPGAFQVSWSGDRKQHTA